ncbi:hypothetical protein BJX70DRAFT_352743 [Aspergillus crustosus]
MSFDSVIQDSDDEDEPLGDTSPEKTNRVPVINQLEQHDAKSHQDGSDIGVDFDQFLESHKDPHMALSSSQQRREDRWIPMAGRIRSMGTVMTEIGLAQQRLFDDDHQAQDAYHPAQSHELEPIQDVNYEVFVGEEAIYDQNPVGPPQDSLLPPQLHLPNPSDDWSQSGPPSNNFIDSSSYTPSGLLNRGDFIKDSSITVPNQTEYLQNPELRRWTSMQGVVSSPHDTEPFSSVISPKAFRAKSDNVAANIVPPSPASVDELSLPVITEMPKVEKRGRKKKQIVVNDEDDELAPQVIEYLYNKPEKRKPGRPPKTTKVVLEDNVTTRPVELSEIEETQEILRSTSTGVSDALAGDSTSPHLIVDGIAEDSVREQTLVTPADQALPSPPKPSKEPKRKKLKRGKTTSVTLTKTYEPDVEDDVIWIDERPIISSTIKEKASTKSTEPKPGTAAEQPPAPKKRGRKRKKTFEQIEQDTLAPPPPLDEQPGAEATISNEEDTATPYTESHTEADLSIVLNNKNTNRTQTLDTPNQPQELQPTSPTKPSPLEPPETPQKPTAPETPSTKGPGKHSPISSTSKVPLRVGLSKRARIAPLLKIIKR